MVEFYQCAYPHLSLTTQIPIEPKNKIVTWQVLWNNNNVACIYVNPTTCDRPFFVAVWIAMLFINIQPGPYPGGGYHVHDFPCFDSSK
jgi:hypothetical protein